jgi:coenzyme F420-reducing hydrogenase alpha subunit
LIELASIPQQLQNLLDQLETVNNIPQLKAASTTGLAQTEAARGRLIHHVQIQQQKISNYQILAPTEWNFHPQGLIAKSLTNLTPKHPEQLDQLARLVINAIDPCVGYSLRIHT